MKNSPQLENGFMRIANEIAEALCKTNLSPYEGRILWAIFRKTYGYNKKNDWISISQLVEITGMHKSHVSRTKKKLIERNIVTQTGNRIAFNKYYTGWRELPKQATSKKVTSRGNSVTSRGNKKLPTEAYTKDNKDNIQKTSDLEIFVKYWNDHTDKKSIPSDIKVINPSVKIKVLKECRKITPDIKKEWDKQTKKGYDLEDAKRAVDIYIKEICLRNKDKSGYFKHRFSLHDFLKRSGGFTRFVNE